MKHCPGAPKCLRGRFSSRHTRWGAGRGVAEAPLGGRRSCSSLAPQPGCIEGREKVCKSVLHTLYIVKKCLIPSI